jgi:hypothetical protein
MQVFMPDTPLPTKVVVCMSDHDFALSTIANIPIFLPNKSFLYVKVSPRDLYFLDSGYTSLDIVVDTNDDKNSHSTLLDRIYLEYIDIFQQMMDSSIKNSSFIRDNPGYFPICGYASKYCHAILNHRGDIQDLQGWSASTQDHVRAVDRLEYLLQLYLCDLSLS